MPIQPEVGSDEPHEVAQVIVGPEQGGRELHIQQRPARADVSILATERRTAVGPRRSAP